MRIDCIDKKVNYESLRDLLIRWAMCGKEYEGPLPYTYTYSARQGDIIASGNSRQEVIKLTLEAQK